MQIHRLHKNVMSKFAGLQKLLFAKYEPVLGGKSKQSSNIAIESLQYGFTIENETKRDTLVSVLCKLS